MPTVKIIEMYQYMKYQRKVLIVYIDVILFYIVFDGFIMDQQFTEDCENSLDARTMRLFVVTIYKEDVCIVLNDRLSAKRMDKCGRLNIVKQYIGSYRFI